MSRVQSPVGAAILHQWCFALAFLLERRAVVPARSVSHRGYGAAVARLTPDQKVGSPNLCSHFGTSAPGWAEVGAHASCGRTHIPEVGLEPTISSLGGRRLIHYATRACVRIYHWLCCASVWCAVVVLLVLCASPCCRALIGAWSVARLGPAIGCLV